MKPLCVVVLLLLTDCTYVSEGVVANKDRYAKTIASDIFGDTAQTITYLDQNWNQYDSLWFYFTTQGSDFIPYDVFLSLEQAGSKALFRTDENMSQYRFLIQKPSHDNPEGLPVGLQVVARPLRETDIFRLAAALEAARPWSAARPTIH